MKIKLIVYFFVYSGLVIQNSSSFAQTKANFIDVYAQGLDEFKNEHWLKADSLFTESLNLWLNEYTYYNRALTRFRMNDAKGGCEDLKNAVILGDSTSGNFYCKYCGIIDTIYRNSSGTIVRSKKSAKKMIVQLKTMDSLLVDSTVIEFWPHDEITMRAEEMPTFPGGELKLFEYLQQEIHYPVEAKRKGIAGRLYATFIIRPDGKLEGVKILRSLDPSCDLEALRVIRKMPNWIPGKNNGEPVSVQYNLPINFTLK
ncbi:MAG: energy transducer TonB [Bacteroidetes bacterium]|nr:energy transducer TonB [Bacteroidota bacterium]MBK9541476.1 energy transducer TonB [Bacteroidota bacterium]MBP6401185.1 energy transducer TonB [Bacteroidia bacterium]MBP6650235.1 energy transducer TonB [Bacteroidia bacterium]